MNLYTLEQTAWNFALQPEVGFLYTLLMAPRFMSQVVITRDLKRQ
jgi:hypothetical protein